jgi:hypothetical protein
LGVIRVEDPLPVGPSLQVRWFSPDGGWSDIALGDFNDDGDQEIVAVRPEGAGGRLTIFDPVATGVGNDHDKFISNIPWDILYTLELTGAPGRVATGSLDPLGRPGDSIVFSRFVPPEERTNQRNSSRVAILRPQAGSTDGRAWELLTEYDSENVWTWIDAGNLDGVGVDELAFVDEPASSLSVFRVGEGLSRIYENRTVENQWQAAVFGDFEAPGTALRGQEIGAVREEAGQLHTAWIFRHTVSNTVESLADVTSALYIPGPRYAFFADIGGNGDDELVMLRRVPQELSNRPRLIVLDNGNDTTAPGALREALLDGDSGYQSGAGGDTDGDGRDEIVIMRDSRIRVFFEPELSARFAEIVTPTNTDTIAAGNLDANGLAAVPRLGALPDALNVTQLVGATGAPLEIDVADVATGAQLPVSVRLAGGSSWASLQTSGSQTPLTVGVGFSAVGLQPGVYRDNVVVDAQQPGVLNDPLLIDLTMMVESGVTFSPSRADVSYFPCAESLPVRSVFLTMDAPAGTTYEAVLSGSPAWVAVSPEQGNLPDDRIVTLTFFPAQRTSDFNAAELRVTFDLPYATGVVETVPVTLTCADNRVLLPIVG